MKILTFNKSLIMATLLLSASIPAHANTALHKQYASLWAEIMFNKSVESIELKLKSLYKASKSAVERQPGDAELLAWSGIIGASYAGEKGGLGALKIAKNSRDALKEALQINAETLDGGAATSLGTLYYKVPGWPIGFGNDNKADKLLGGSAKKYPMSITSQYFYGDFLIDQKRYEEAHSVYSKAINLEPRKDAFVADTTRLELMRETLNKLNQKLK